MLSKKNKNRYNILLFICIILIYFFISSKSDVKSRPLITHIYTADPSAHVFKGKLYIYPSHDIENNIPDDGMGAQFDMKDYHVFSIDKVGGKIIDHGEILNVDDIPWATSICISPVS